MPVYVLVGGLAAGDSMEDVCEGYSVSEEDVRAALAYATEVLCAASPSALEAALTPTPIDDAWLEELPEA